MTWALAHHPVSEIGCEAMTRKTGRTTQSKDIAVGCAVVIALAVALGFCLARGPSPEGPARVQAIEAKAKALTACEAALRENYRVAIDVSPWTSEYRAQGGDAVVEGEDELPDGSLVKFRCEFRRGKLASATAE